jgi:hypothetical protein
VTAEIVAEEPDLKIVVAPAEVRRRPEFRLQMLTDELLERIDRM